MVASLLMLVATCGVDVSFWDDNTLTMQRPNSSVTYHAQWTGRCQTTRPIYNNRGYGREQVGWAVRGERMTLYGWSPSGYWGLIKIQGKPAGWIRIIR